MEVTIEITDYCPHECDYCFTNAEPARKNIIGLKEVENFLAGIHGIDRINISGGEPLSHPDFYRILELCNSYTHDVWVYTNAIKKIIYNTDIVKEIKVEANVCLTPGREVYIPENVDKVHLLQLVPQGRAKDMKPANIKVSGNIPRNDCNCECCDHVLLQANRAVMTAPCKKDY